MNMLPGKLNAKGVKLASRHSANLCVDGEVGKNVFPGVRPDHLKLDAEKPIVEGQVSVREPLGPETLIHAKTVTGEIIAKADGRTPPELDETVLLGAAFENMHLFDAATGMALV